MYIMVHVQRIVGNEYICSKGRTAQQSARVVSQQRLS